MGDERRVRGVADVELSILQEAADILQLSATFTSHSILYADQAGLTHLPTKAIPNTTNLLHAEVLTEIFDSRFAHRIHVRGLVVFQPTHQVHFAGVHVLRLDGVTPEQVGDDGQEATVGKLVGEELAVVVNAHDIGEDENGLFGVLVAGVGDVGVN